MSGFRLSTVRRAVPILAASGLLMTLLSASPAAASDPFTLTVYIGSSCVYGSGPGSDHVTILVRDRDGRLVSRRRTTADSGGDFSACLNRAIETHDHLTVKDASNTHDLIVPVLTTTTDRVTDVVSGRAAPGADVSIEAYHYATYTNGSSFIVHATAATSGAWSTDFSSTVDLIGTDFIYTWVQSPAGDVIYRDLRVPSMIVFPGSNDVSGYASPGTLVKVMLKTASGQLKGTATDIVQVSGYFSSEFRDGNWAAEYPRAGNRIVATFASDAHFIYPQASVQGTASNDRIAGRCLPDRPFEAYSYHNSGSNNYAYQYGTTTSTGRFSVDMSSGDYPSFDLLAGDYIEVECKTAAGDQLEQQGTAQP